MIGHLITSIFKSGIRILGGITCIILMALNNITVGLIVLAAAFTGAELLGILEEILDKRK